MRDIHVAIGMIAFFALLGAAYALRSLLAGRVRHARIDAHGGSLFLNKPTMEMVYWLLEPMISFIAALRITPNMVTLFALLPAAGAGVAIGFGCFGIATLLATLATFCDIIDGLLARKTGTVSEAGEVIDAAVDRYGEFFLFAGLVYYYRTHDQCLFIVLAALAGSFMVSYATAKAEAMGVPAPRGAMRRGERAAYLIFGAAFTPIFKALFHNSPSLALQRAADHPGAEHRRGRHQHLGPFNGWRRWRRRFERARRRPSRQRSRRADVGSEVAGMRQPGAVEHLIVSQAGHSGRGLA